MFALGRVGIGSHGMGGTISGLVSSGMKNLSLATTCLVDIYRASGLRFGISQHMHFISRILGETFRFGPLRLICMMVLMGRRAGSLGGKLSRNGRMVMPFLNANRFSRLPESVCVSGLWKDSRWAPLDVLIPAL